MRRRLPLALAALLLALAGCGGDEGDEPTTEVTAAADIAQSTTDDPPAGDDPTSRNGASGADGKNQDDEGSADDGDAADEAPPDEDQTTPKVDAKGLGKPDEGDDEAAATETVERYYQALAAGDNEFACDLLSRKAQKEVDALLAQVPKRARAGEDCATLLDLLYGQVPEAMLADFGEAAVTSVDLKGKQRTRAIAYVEIPEQEPIAIRLSFDRGTWRLDQVSGSYA